MTKFEKSYKMTCEEAQLLMVPMWAKMPGISNDEKIALNTHLIICSECSKEYEETKELMSLVKGHWGPISTETRQLLEKAGYKVLEQKHISTNRSRPMTVEESWKDLCRRCPDLIERTEKPRSLQLFLRIGAVAACLVIGVFTWLVFSNYSKPHFLSQASSFSGQVVSTLKPSVKIELVDGKSTFLVPAGTKITTAKDELKTLVINSNRRMMLNQNTNLTIEPLTQNCMIGCVVKLEIGEIYTHVEHDGKPFIVQTPHGQAVITGTTFDIKADDNNTSLVVAEGTVRFKSDKETVHVLAHQQSTIANNLPPTQPSVCDTAQLTAWAHAASCDNKNIAYTSLADEAALTDLLLNSQPSPIDIEKIDYATWVEDNREWFQREFPWTFELKDALSKEGIYVDYPELLIRSGEIWRLAYYENMQTNDGFDLNSIFRLGMFYNRDSKWITEHMRCAKDLNGISKTNIAYIDSNALCRWKETIRQMYLSPEKRPGIFISSSDFAIYIAKTRTLTWICMNKNKFNPGYTYTSIDQEYLKKECAAAWRLVGLLSTMFSQQQECSRPYSNLLSKIENDANIVIEGESHNADSLNNRSTKVLF
jgi:hypothetical protein